MANGRAYVAIMRKRLHAIYGMFTTNTDFVARNCMPWPQKMLDRHEGIYQRRRRSWAEALALGLLAIDCGGAHRCGERQYKGQRPS